MSNVLEYYTYQKIPKCKVQWSCWVMHLKEGPLVIDLWDWVLVVALRLRPSAGGKCENVIWEHQALCLDSLGRSRD